MGPIFLCAPLLQRVHPVYPIVKPYSYFVYKLYFKLKLVLISYLTLAGEMRDGMFLPAFLLV